MSVVQILSVKLQRADQSVSWGFNIQGGIDQNMPLMIIKVNPTSLADRCSMRPGDYIIKIGNTSTEFLSSHDCRETIIRQGNDLNLTLFRGAIPKHDDYLASFQFPQPQLMNAHAPKLPAPAAPTLSPQVGVQLSTNKALLTQSYNSPVGLYSSKNIADTMTAAIKSLSKDADSAENSGSERDREHLNRYDSASLNTNTINSLSSSSSSTSVSPTTVQNLRLDEMARPSSPNALLSPMNAFNPVPKPFYKSQVAQEVRARPESPLVAKKMTAESPKPLTTAGALTAKLQGLDFRVVQEETPTGKLPDVALQQAPSSAELIKSAVDPNLNYEDIDKETEETFRKYRGGDSGAAFKRESFSQTRQTISMDANNNETKPPPSALEKILAERRQSEMTAPPTPQELAVRLNQSPSRSPLNGRFAKSKSIAVDNQSYYDLHNFSKQSPKLPQHTIQDSYLSQLNNPNRNNYSINKTVSPTYKPFSNQYPTPSYLNKEPAKGAEVNKPMPSGRAYVGKLDDPRRPSLTQSRTFELLRRTLDSENQEEEMVTYNNLTNKNEIRRCSLNTNLSSPKSAKANPLAPSTLKKPANEANDDDVDQLRDQFLKSKHAQSRSASIASSSPSSAESKISRNTPYYHHFKKFEQEVKEEEENFDADADTQDHMDALKRLMERRRNGNVRSLSLNDSSVVPYSSRKYSAQIAPVAGIREDDETAHDPAAES